MIVFLRLSVQLPAEAERKIDESTSVMIEAETAMVGGGAWIRSRTELVRTYPVAIDVFRAVIEDYESYPRFIPRLRRTIVLNHHGAAATIRQRYEINILGYRYPTEYELTLEPDDSAVPFRWTLSWHLADSDGNVVESRGSWTLEIVPDGPGRQATRVTHRNEGLVRRKFPLQLTVMRAVAERELGRSIEAVFLEARRRAEALARAVPSAR